MSNTTCVRVPQRVREFHSARRVVLTFALYLNAICLFIHSDVFAIFAVYQLISRRRFQQIDVLEGQNILVTISGKKNKIRVYYLSWLKGKILKTEGVSNGFTVVMGLIGIAIISYHMCWHW